jgi:hypothetical protein
MRALPRQLAAVAAWHAFTYLPAAALGAALCAPPPGTQAYQATHGVDAAHHNVEQMKTHVPGEASCLLAQGQMAPAPSSQDGTCTLVAS